MTIAKTVMMVHYDCLFGRKVAEWTGKNLFHSSFLRKFWPCLLFVSEVLFLYALCLLPLLALHGRFGFHGDFYVGFWEAGRDLTPSWWIEGFLAPTIQKRVADVLTSENLKLTGATEEEQKNLWHMSVFDNVAFPELFEQNFGSGGGAAWQVKLEDGNLTHFNPRTAEMLYRTNHPRARLADGPVTLWQLMHPESFWQLNQNDTDGNRTNKGRETESSGTAPQITRYNSSTIQEVQALSDHEPGHGFGSPDE
ncbi:unnamed protein product [Amoebophrya sp. A120]|nr:unnamed protein product [Amoebophrya sp. A120]|eukprot:GSA120T00025703001.1